MSPRPRTVLMLRGRTFSMSSRTGRRPTTIHEVNKRVGQRSISIGCAEHSGFWQDSGLQCSSE
eukprot:1810921-Lingulodinium_polyedra.AAC.1